MYHKSNLGKFAKMVDYYADTNGYVPESYADMEDLAYDDPTGCLSNDPAYAAAFVDDAVAATEAANNAAEEWQKVNI